MIPLPESPGPRSLAFSLIDAGGVLTPPLGGPLQRINRMGSRFRALVTMPPLSQADGRVWVNRLIRGKFEGVRLAIPLMDFDVGTPGSVVVDGAGQAGSTLDVKGATAAYPFKEGQWFNHFDDARYYLYQAAADTTADGSGEAALPITPMLRVEPGDEDTLVFGQPVIEGLVEGDELQWQIAVERLIGLEFVITEMA